MANETLDTFQTGSQSSNDLAGSARETLDTAREAVDQVADRARKTIDQVADTAAGYADRVSSQASDTVSQALRYTSTHPLQALGAVLLAGFVIGRLTRR